MVADSIGIPHYMVNAVDVFKETVIKDFIDEYKAGRTPNPCVRCNQFVKFDYLMKKADELGCEYVATGHYAIRTGKYLFKGKDEKKDQAYFLYVIYGCDIERILFPLGTMTKEQIRVLAAERGLVTAHKPESQDICFVENGNYSLLLEQEIKAVAGRIVDTNGNVVGNHTGIYRYTIGQRKGLGALGQRMFVKEIRPLDNTIVVATEESLGTSSIIIKDCVFCSDNKFDEGKKYGIQVRYRSKPVDGLVSMKSKSQVLVTFSEPVRAVAPGQSAVIYNGEMVVGGGIIVGL
jgi:tRNA-specific 2-thiouridylase